MSENVSKPLDCPVDGCDGEYGPTEMYDHGDNRFVRFVSTCDHTILMCAVCSDHVPGSQMWFAKRGPKGTRGYLRAMLCEGCAKGNKIAHLPAGES